LERHETAIVEDVEYFFDRETLTASASLSWRVVDSIDKSTTETGFSGAILSLGHPSEPTTKAAVFQNHELPLHVAKIKGMEGYTDPREDPGFSLKAGLILPREVYGAEIPYERQEHA